MWLRNRRTAHLPRPRRTRLQISLFGGAVGSSIPRLPRRSRRGARGAADQTRRSPRRNSLSEGIPSRIQRARWSERFGTRISLRNAVFTDRSSGKCSATSGDRSTRLVPDRYRPTYFPRTPPFNLDRSYFERSPLPALRFRFTFLLFILISLARRRLSSAYDPNILTTIGMGHDNKPTCFGDSDCDEPPLRNRMIRIVIRDGQGIAKNRRRFMERNPVLPAILPLFAWIPFEVHGVTLFHNPRIRVFQAQWRPTIAPNTIQTVL